MPDISIVMSCRNEEKNLPVLIPALHMVMAASRLGTFEIVVVDHLCTDNTNQVACDLGIVPLKCWGPNLGHALLTGIFGASGGVVLVMDADLQHNPNDVPRLLVPVLDGSYDFVVGSRSANKGQREDWKFSRQVISRVARLMTRPLTGVSDSTSGFFAFRRELLTGCRLEPSSWKMMLEVLVKSGTTRVLEVPIVFGDRRLGESKFTLRQTFLYARHLAKLALFKFKRGW